MLIQLRTDTAANWTAANPVLAEGEVGIEWDTGRQKNGNGTTAWNSLPYAGGGANIPANVQTGTTYTIATSDAGGEVQMDNPSANTVYVDASLFTQPGVYVLVRQIGTGPTTIAAASSPVTTIIQGGPTLRAAQQGSAMYIRINSVTNPYEAYVGGEVANQ